MLNFYIYYNTHIYIKNNGKSENGTLLLTDTEIYCSASQIGTASSTILTPLGGTSSNYTA